MPSNCAALGGTMRLPVDGIPVSAVLEAVIFALKFGTVIFNPRNFFFGLLGGSSEGCHDLSKYLFVLLPPTVPYLRGEAEYATTLSRT